MFKYGNGDYMLKNLKKYSLFLVLTVFINLINIDGVKAVDEYYGTDTGQDTVSGCGEIDDWTARYSSASTNVAKPGIRITVVNSSGVQYADTYIYDYSTWTYDEIKNLVSNNSNQTNSSNMHCYMGNGINYGTTNCLNNLKKGVSGTSYEGLSEISLKDKVAKASDSVWTYFNSNYNFYRDLKNTLSNDNSFRKDILSELNVPDDVITGESSEANNYYLKIEPITLFIFREDGCVNNQKTTGRFIYGTSSEIYNQENSRQSISDRIGFNYCRNTNTTCGGTGTPCYMYGAGYMNLIKRVFTLSQSDATSAGYTGGSFIDGTGNDYGYVLVRLGDLPKITEKTYRKYKIKTTITNATCSPISTGEATISSRTISNGTTTNESINFYNEKYGKKKGSTITLSNGIKCSLYCLDNYEIKYPKGFQELQSSQANYYKKDIGSRFTWIQETGDYSLTVKQTSTCQLLPSDESRIDVSTTDYKKCANARVKIDNRVKTSDLNNLKSVTAFLTYQASSSENYTFELVSKETIASSIDEGNRTSECNDKNTCRSKATSRNIIFTTTYSYTLNTSTNTSFPDLGATNLLYVSEAAVKNQNYNMTIKFNGLDVDSYTCKYRARKCSYKYSSSNISYSPPICENNANVGTYSIENVENRSVCIEDELTRAEKNLKYGNVKKDYGNGCYLYCNEKVILNMPKQLENKISIGSPFKWIDNEIENYKLYSLGIYECRVLPKTDDLATYQICLNQKVSYNDYDYGYTENSSNSTKELSLSYQYSDKFGNVKETELALSKEKTEDVACDNCEYNSSCSNISDCDNKTANRVIKIQKQATYNINTDATNSNKLFISTINGDILISTNNQTSNLYSKYPSNFLYASRFSKIGTAYNLKITINALGSKNGDKLIFNDPNKLNYKSENIEGYVCNYNVAREASCYCPEYTLHAGENPYNYIDEADKNNYTCSEAVQQFCNEDKPGTPTKIPEKPTIPKDQLIYRTIDLNNPFPGKDGDGRTPGSNWNSTTLIENKITKTTNAYNETPIYKITLIPSTIKEIREYNDNHDYLDYENLNCNEAGVACISSFLHGTSTGTNTTSAIVEVSGDCKNVTHNNFYTCLHYDDGTKDVY